MANNKIDNLEDEFKAEVSDSAVRARNRTVMLTPEITGQVRARLSRGQVLEERSSGSYGFPEPESEFLDSGQEDNYQQEDSESSNEDSVEETVFSGSREEEYNEPAPARISATNPIAREIHKLSSPIEEKTLNPNISSMSQSKESFPPQRREAVPLGSTSLESRRDVESSLPSPEPEHFKPVFDDNNGESEEEINIDDVMVWTKITPVVGFLVSFDNDPHGQVLFIRSGRLLVTAEIPNGGNYLYLTDETVSPMHSILRVTEDAQIQVLDNLSEYGTTIVRADNGEEVALSGD